MNTNFLKRVLESSSGYFIYKKSALPFGSVFSVDMERLGSKSFETVFDIGANIGQTAIYYANLFPCSKIYSFEPVFHAYEQLVRNTAHLHRVHPLRLGIGNRDGIANIKIIDEASTINTFADTSASRNCPTQPVDLLKLDSYCNSNHIQCVDLVKIDVEGYECEVIEGARQSLSRQLFDMVLAEVSLGSLNQDNSSLCKVLSSMSCFGYQLVGLYETSLMRLPTHQHYSNALFLSPKKISKLSFSSHGHAGWPFLTINA
jgi:FkbM family methyltransferase